MIVVADSSPLVILSKTGYFDLIQKLCPNILVTPQVYTEVVAHGAELPGAAEVKGADWMKVTPLANLRNLLAAQSQFSLGAGELSTILLAEEVGAPLVLIDDLPARKLAQRRGLVVRGTVGILEELFARGEISNLRTAFLSLVRTNAYIELDLLNKRLAPLGLPPID